MAHQWLTILLCVFLSAGPVSAQPAGRDRLGLAEHRQGELATSGREDSHCLATLPGDFVRNAAIITPITAVRTHMQMAATGTLSTEAPREITDGTVNRLWRTPEMSHFYRYPSPVWPDPRRGPPQFKTLYIDPELVQLEQQLRAINQFERTDVQQYHRLARFGVEQTRVRAKAYLRQVVVDYRIRVMRSGDAFEPGATPEQISNNGAGIHVLDQAGNGIQLRIDQDVPLLGGVIFGRQGSGKTSAAYNILRQITTPFLVLDPKNCWTPRARPLKAKILPVLSLDLRPPPGVRWEDWLFAVMEAVSLATGLQYGLDLLLEASEIALAQREDYMTRVNEDPCLCLRDILGALALCDTARSRRADYKAAATTALHLLIGMGDNPIFSTRGGLPLDRILLGRYIIPCPFLNTFQARFLGLYLFLYMQHVACSLPETMTLRHLTLIDDASKFVGKPDSLFGTKTTHGPWMHTLKVLRSSGYGALFIDQLPDSVLEDIRSLCHLWLVVGSIQGEASQNAVAAAMSLNKEQKQMLGRLQNRQCVFYGPAGHPLYPYPIHGVVPDINSPI